MNIYKLERLSYIGYDECASFVVWAYGPNGARRVCAENAADEGRGPWEDEKRSSCVLVGKAFSFTKADFPGGLICRDFRAG